MRAKGTTSETSSLRPSTVRTGSNMSTTSTTEKDLDLRKRFAMHRQESTLSKVVLCLSYKGKNQRNFVPDVHDLVFRLPTLEYRNKTWSNLDLVMQLKKEVMKALVTHAGAIVGNFFTSHKPNKIQQSRLRELANSSILLGLKADPSTAANSESTSTSVMELDESDDDVRPSFTSGDYSTYPDSLKSSAHSDWANGFSSRYSPSRPRTSGSERGAGSGSIAESSVRDTFP